MEEIAAHYNLQPVGDFLLRIARLGEEWLRVSKIVNRVFGKVSVSVNEREAAK